MSIRKIEKWVTSDGKEFADADSAYAWERAGAMREWLYKTALACGYESGVAAMVSRDFALKLHAAFAICPRENLK